MARCAVHSATMGLLSGICVLRIMEWRGALLNQVNQDESLGVARCA
ncbi:hypothetical protein A2U01_0080753, partial [Trifolium medium]|nr:hypothetical protein [Trifolium medium]